MPKVNADKQAVSEVLTRGVENIYPSRLALEKKLLSGERLRLYCGYDATAPSLHIGNTLALNKLAQFQALGHEVIFLIGDFTTMIGDPTDKKQVRRQRSRAEALANAKNYQKQAAAYLDFKGPNAAKLKYNSAWNDQLNFKDLIGLASHFTVQQMIQRDMFQERLKAARPIYLHEFLYPLTQAYDSLMLDVDIEVGGNDQTFNMLCGRELLKVLKNKEKFVLTLKLLTDEKGEKMGKTEGNVIFLDENPQDMYGQIMSWPDNLIVTAFELGTKVSTAEIASIAASLKKGEDNPRDWKMKLAWEITKINHGLAAADKAQAHFVRVIQKKELPMEMDELAVARSAASLEELLSLLVPRLFASKSEARRLLKEGGIKINGAVVKDSHKKYKIGPPGLVLQRGKKSFLRLIKK